jgi:hypothetical protein
MKGMCVRKEGRRQRYEKVKEKEDIGLGLLDHEHKGTTNL